MKRGKRMSKNGERKEDVKRGQRRETYTILLKEKKSSKRYRWLVF